MRPLRALLFMLLFNVFTALVVVLGCPVLLALPRRQGMRPLLHFYAWAVLGMLRLVCGVRLRVTGRENLPPGAVLVAAKHQSAFDTVVWLMLVPDACYVLKQELLKLPVWGWLARKSRMIPVDRKAGAKALRGMLGAARSAAEEGRQIIIFPEGTRTEPGERVRYQPGVAGLAAALQVPVVPVATDSGRCWPPRRFAMRPGVITVAILPPLPAGLERNALLPALESAIEAESARLLTAENTCG
jgi:1-acyl-sn-glycerol-3-phosphate acyltransferase